MSSIVTMCLFALESQQTVTICDIEMGNVREQMRTQTLYYYFLKPEVAGSG